MLDSLFKDDRSEQMKIVNRRLYEESRKERIFNGRYRMFGLDLKALELQIADKNKAKTFKEQLRHQHDKEMTDRQYAIHGKDIELKQREKILQSDIDTYRCRLQRPEDRREFDLNDPMIIKNGTPTRASDEDPRLGISSAQIFEGEDLGYSRRKELQHLQQCAWLDHQHRERQRENESKALAHKADVNQLLCRDQKLTEMACGNSTIRQNITDDTVDYNRKMAAQKQLERKLYKKEIYEDNMAEMYNMLTSDMLTENRDVAQSPSNPNKKIANMYRGMTDEELILFRQEQERYNRSVSKLRSDKILLFKQWEQFITQMDYELQLKEIELSRKDYRRMQDHTAFNKNLAIEQKELRAKEKQNRNEFKPEFFAQFNTTSR